MKHEQGEGEEGRLHDIYSLVLLLAVCNLKIEAAL